MGPDGTLASLVEGAYAAALDDTLWVGWADRVVGALGGSLGAFVVLDAQTATVRRLFHVRHAQRLEDEYYDLQIGQLDPQMPCLISRTESGYYLDTDHVDVSDPRTAEFTKWITCNVGMRHHMTALALLDRGRIRAAVSIHRRVADGATPVAEQEKLAAILPDVTRAMELGFVHNQKLLESYWSGLATTTAEPALLLDESGGVLRATPSMGALLSRDDALDIVGGRLCAASLSDEAQLQALLNRVVAPSAPRSGAMRVTRRSGRPALVLTTFPLPRANRLLAPAEAAALVTVVDPSAAPNASPALWREAFALSAREGELAAKLMAGHSVESAAATLAISEATARSHLRRLLAKTDTTRQSDLMRLLSRVV